MKINPQKLSRIIMSRDHKNSQAHLLQLYEALTEKQKKKIRKMLEDIKSNPQV